MARFILLGFLLLPLAEIAMFVVVGQAVGLWMTLALVIAGALLGGLLLRQQGLGIVARLRSNMGAGTLPAQTMFDAMMIGIAGFLLMLPGFISDIVALALLIPPLRAALYAGLASRMTVVQTTSASYRRHADVNDPQISRPRTIDLDDDDWRRDRD